MDAHLAIDFGIAGLQIQHYRAEQSVAAIFATELLEHHLASWVRIDTQLTDDMKPLPYQRLYLFDPGSPAEDSTTKPGTHPCEQRI